MNHYSYEEISIGHKESFLVEVKQEMLDNFQYITGISTIYITMKISQKTVDINQKCIRYVEE